MKEPHFRNFLERTISAGIVFIILGSTLGYVVVRLSSLSKQVDTLTLELASTTLSLAQNTRQLSKNVTDLTNTQQNIDAVKTQVGGVVQTVGSISGTVGSLQKLSQIDPELLKKYSKVYFMNENYVPAHLTPIPPQYTYSSGARTEQFLLEAMPRLKNLFDDAKSSGVTLYVTSGFRSFKEQKSLKSSYAVTYGAGTANTFSAEQGYSEHQLGTTIDITTTELRGGLTGFDKTEAYEWLRANAYRYGFQLSYPKGNTYYTYEPWHWRYVGIKLATYLHDNTLNFYDMDQRDIDTFLSSTFD